MNRKLPPGYEQRIPQYSCEEKERRGRKEKQNCANNDILSRSLFVAAEELSFGWRKCDAAATAENAAEIGS